MRARIIELEEKLRVAMLTSDIKVLDELISEKLLFTNHVGQLITKEEDLKSHRNKTFIFSSIQLSESTILQVNDSFIVCVKADIEGLYHGQPANGCFRFTRFWSLHANTWKVVAGHSSMIN